MDDEVSCLVTEFHPFLLPAVFILEPLDWAFEAVSDFENISYLTSPPPLISFITRAVS